MGTPDGSNGEKTEVGGESGGGADDSIGEPYAKGRAEQTPPCGVRYLRSSGGGTYGLQSTVTWKITWTGTGNPNPQPVDRSTQFGEAGRKSSLPPPPDCSLW